MRPRPLSITIIAWFLIVASIISIVTTVTTRNDPLVRELMAKSPLPISVQFGWSITALLVTLIAATAWLKGENWGRWLYVIWGGFGFLVSLVISPMKMMLIPGLVIFALFVFFLFRPAANDYFLSSSERHAHAEDD